MVKEECAHGGKQNTSPHGVVKPVFKKPVAVGKASPPSPTRLPSPDAAKRALRQLAAEGDVVAVAPVIELLADAGFATEWLEKLNDDDDDVAYEIVCDAMEEAMQQDGCVAEALDRARRKVLLEETERQEALLERGTKCSNCNTPWSEESGVHDDGEGHIDLCDSCMCGACGTRREYEGQMGGTCHCG